LPRWFPPRCASRIGAKSGKIYGIHGTRGIREKGTLKKLLNHWSIEKKISTNSLGPKIIFKENIIFQKMLKRSGSHKIHLIIISWSWLRPNWRRGLLRLLGKWLRRRRWGIQHVCLASEELWGIIYKYLEHAQISEKLFEKKSGKTNSTCKRQ